MRSRVLLPILIVALLSSGSSCGNSSTEPIGPARQTGIKIQPTDLWPLVAGQGFYELWLGVPAVVPAEGEKPWELEQLWTAAAAFRIDGEGKVRTLQGSVLESFRIPPDLDSGRIARGVITYQPSQDAGGPHPMGEWLSVGNFVAPGGTISSTLSWDSDEVFDKDLRELAGTFRVRTETAEGGVVLPRGLWFYQPTDPGEGTPAAPTLVLGAALPEGYVYEAWTFQRGLSSLTPLQQYPLGRFEVSDASDSDGAGPYRAPGAPMEPVPYPGQDFVNGTVIDFSDGSWSAMITIEPQIDPMPQVPSSLRVLERHINVGDGIDVDLVLTNRAAQDRLPKALVTIVR